MLHVTFTDGSRGSAWLDGDALVIRSGYPVARRVVATLPLTAVTHATLTDAGLCPQSVRDYFHRTAATAA